MISINDNYTIYDIKILNECNEINGYSINRLSDNKANVNFKSIKQKRRICSTGYS